jgi:hypothetical protein
VIKNKIKHLLLESGIKLLCPRCEYNEFEIIGNSNVLVVGDVTTIDFNIDTIVTACKKCGFISQHASVIIKKYL